MVKLILTSAAAALLLTTPAQACRSPQSETHVFLPSLPEDLSPAMVVLRVAPPMEATGEDYVREVTVVEAVQGDWNHDTAIVDFGPFSSCSRAYLPEDGAFVVGQRSILPARLVVRQYRLSELAGDEHGE